MYIIRARVTGGVTGTRTAPVKDSDGAVKRFDTFEEASVEASNLMRKANHNPFRTADFAYWPEEETDATPFLI